MMTWIVHFYFPLNVHFYFTIYKVGEVIDKIEYGYSMFHLSMDCFWTKTVANRLIPKKTEDARWLTVDTLQI